MSNTNKDKDFRLLRRAGNSIRCLFGPAPLRKQAGKSQHYSEEGKRILNTYTKKELYDLANRRHSAAHRKSAMKTKNRCKRREKRSENRQALEEAMSN